jgi:hypothetical protein
LCNKNKEVFMSQNEEQDLAIFLENEKLLRESYLEDNLVTRITLGWIDALGQFWGNKDPGRHAHLIQNCFGMSLEVIQEESWIIVLFAEDQSWAIEMDKKPNDLQNATLRKIGLDPENPSAPYDASNALTFEELYPNGYADHVYPPQMGQLDMARALLSLQADKEYKAKHFSNAAPNPQ